MSAHRSGVTSVPDRKPRPCFRSATAEPRGRTSRPFLTGNPALAFEARVWAEATAPAAPGDGQRGGTKASLPLQTGCPALASGARGGRGGGGGRCRATGGRASGGAATLAGPEPEPWSGRGRARAGLAPMSGYTRRRGVTPLARARSLVLPDGERGRAGTGERPGRAGAGGGRRVTVGPGRLPPQLPPSTSAGPACPRWTASSPAPATRTRRAPARASASGPRSGATCPAPRWRRRLQTQVGASPTHQPQTGTGPGTQTPPHLPDGGSDPAPTEPTPHPRPRTD